MTRALRETVDGSRAGIAEGVSWGVAVLTVPGARAGVNSGASYPASTKKGSGIAFRSPKSAKLYPKLARRHADRAVEADVLAVEVSVGDHRQRQLGVLLGVAEALGERHGGGQRILHL